MKRNGFKLLTLLAVFLFLSMVALELTAQARVGGSRSLGSRGSRSYSRPAVTYSQPAAPRPQPAPQYAPRSAPAPGSFQQPAGGGFLRGVAGGMVGGMLGSMLFGSHAGAAGMGGMGGHGGIGLFEIVLLAGGGYLLYRLLKRRI